VKYQLKRDSRMYLLWNALPLGQWVSAGEVNRLAPAVVVHVPGTMAGLVARNLVQRRQSRSHLNAYDYMRLPESEAVEPRIPDGTVSPVGGPDRAPLDVGGAEPFWTPQDAPPISGGADAPSPPLVPVPHGSARRYMAGCRCVECTRAYETTMKALGLS